MLKNKRLALLLVLTLVTLSLFGCRLLAPQETPAPDPPRQSPIVPDEAVEDDEAVYEDGVYSGESEVDDRGWKGIVEFVVEGGQITQVNFDEVNEEGDLKSEDEDYNQRWEEQAGISSGEAYPGYEEALMDSQDIDEVDVITGATSTFGKFTKAVEDALERGPQENGTAG